MHHVISYRLQLAHVFLHLNNSSGNKWFDFKIPFQNVCTIIPFPTCSLTKYLKPIVLKFYIFWPMDRCLAYNLTNLFKLLINFLGLFHNASNTTLIAPSFNFKYPLMRVHTSHRPYRYPLLMLCSWQWTHKNPWCNSRHLCCYYMGCWLPNGLRITTCVSF
jgi:hypothetical protein